MMRQPRSVILMFPLLWLVLSFISCNQTRYSEAPQNGQVFKVKRENMVAEQLVRRDIEDPEVLRAMGKVPRHEFVPPALYGESYEDWPLPIGYDQTISQPYVVAYMTEALAIEKGSKVLEIGTGSGYQAAVLVEMGAKVYTIEIIPELGERAAGILDKLGYRCMTRIGDGYDGWPEAAPFDAVIVTAAPRTVPKPLVDQLREGGRLVIPVGYGIQNLEVYTKKKGLLRLLKTLPVRFVPMTGKSQHIGPVDR